MEALSSSLLNDPMTKFSLLSIFKSGNVLFDTLLLMSIPFLLAFLGSLTDRFGNNVVDWITRVLVRKEAQRIILYSYSKEAEDRWKIQKVEDRNDILQKAIYLY